MQLKTEREKHTPPIWLFWKARRYVMILFIFLGMANSYALRTIMSIAIIAMTQSNNVTLENGTVIMQREFEWNSVEQGYILSSFFYGFIISQFFGGYLSLYVPAKYIWVTSIGGTAVFTFFTPWLARLNLGWFLAIRVISGTLEGAATPTVHQFWANWTPPAERNRLVTTGMSGMYFGTVATLALAPLVSVAFGWAGIFYVFGLIGIIWTILFMLLTSNTPDEDPRISQEELKYINDGLKEVNRKVKLKTPWKSIFTSVPVYAYFISAVAEYWGFYTLLTELPRFMSYILNFDLNQVGFLSSLPYLVLFIVFQISGHVSDYFLKKMWLTVTQLRRTSSVLGFLGQAAFLLVAMHWLNPAGCIFCFLIALGAGGFVLGTLGMTSMDMSPNFGSILMGTMSSLITLPSIIVPIITGYIVTDEGNVDQWRIIFYIAAGFYLIGGTTFGLFGSGELQKWNNPENERNPKDNDQNSREV